MPNSYGVITILYKKNDKNKQLKIFKMRIYQRTPFSPKRLIFTNIKTNKEYVLQGYVASENHLIPFVPHWHGGTCTEYWEPHYAKRDTWIPISKANLEEFGITEEWYKTYQEDSDKAYQKILEKYQNSF